MNSLEYYRYILHNHVITSSITSSPWSLVLHHQVLHHHYITFITTITSSMLPLLHHHHHHHHYCIITTIIASSPQVLHHHYYIMQDSVASYVKNLKYFPAINMQEIFKNDQFPEDSRDHPGLCVRITP